MVNKYSRYHTNTNMFYLICFVFCGLYGSKFNALDQRTSYLLVAYVHFEEGVLEYLRQNKVYIYTFNHHQQDPSVC